MFYIVSCTNKLQELGFFFNFLGVKCWLLCVEREGWVFKRKRG